MRLTKSYISNKNEPKVDRRFRKLFPNRELKGEELEAYIDRLRTEEGFARIYVWREKNVILDGHLKYHLCKKYDIPYQIIYVAFAHRDEAKRWIIDRELQRRHLSSWKRCSLVIKYWKPIFEKIAKQNQRLSKGRGRKGRKKSSADFAHTDVRERLAEKARVSRDTISKVLYILEKGREEDFEKAESEEKSIYSLYLDVKHRRKKKHTSTLPFRNNLTNGVVDKVICKPAIEGIKLIPDGLLSLALTSPPFACGKTYADGIRDDASVDNHLDMLRKTFEALLPKFRAGGRCVIEYQEIQARSKEERLVYYNRPVHAQIVNMMFGIGYKYFTTIIWNKRTTGRSHLKWGSYLSPSAPRIRTTHSYLFVFCVDDYTLKCQTGDDSELSAEDFHTLTKSVWNIAPETHGYGTNPVPMPVLLAENVIKIGCFREDVVCDCFGGSGTTAIAALRQQRRFIHIDASKTYCAETERRIEEEMAKLNHNITRKKVA